MPVKFKSGKRTKKRSNRSRSRSFGRRARTYKRRSNMHGGNGDITTDTKVKRLEEFCAKLSSEYDRVMCMKSNGTEQAKTVLTGGWYF